MTGRHDWYRLTTWSESDRQEFEARLSRSRKSNRSDYLTTQAWHLFSSGLFDESLLLLNRMFNDYPKQANLSSGYLLQAKCHAALANFELAVDAFRLSLQTERDFPNVRTEVELEFAEFVVSNDLEKLFPEALSALDEFHDSESDFPLHAYMYFALKACLLDSLGLAGAKSSARRAKAAAKRTHSGFRNHPTLCLVDNEPDWLRKRLDRMIEG